MQHEVPGFADQVSEDVLTAWNKKVFDLSEVKRKSYPNSSFVLDPPKPSSYSLNSLNWSPSPISWLACLDQDLKLVRELCDFDPYGRYNLQNEYLEYQTVYRKDSHGKDRPKRVIFTTELREYWEILATHDPSFLKDLATKILGRDIGWHELYGEGFDAQKATKENRLKAFQAEMQLDRVIIPGIPETITNFNGSLNQKNILFMGHHNNTLDALLTGIVETAQVFCTFQPDLSYRTANKAEVFLNDLDRECRKSDPIIMYTASRAAFEGRKISFQEPLGIYIMTDSTVLRQSFFIKNAPIPIHWIRLSRGYTNRLRNKGGNFQRLEFGPSDQEPYFLDEIQVSFGSELRQMAGGYDVADKLEVGPLVIIGESSKRSSIFFKDRTPEQALKSCKDSETCKVVLELKKKLDGEKK